MPPEVFKAPKIPEYMDFISAVDAGNVEAAELLLLSGVSIDLDAIYKGSSKAALHIASEHGHLAMVDFLLKSGASVDLYDGDPYSGATALHLATYNAHADVVQRLLDAGIDVNIRGGYVYGTAAHFPFFPSLTSDKKLLEGHPRVMGVLLDNGLDLSITDHLYGNTPLHYAAESGELPLACLFIDRGADVNAVSSSQMSVLSIAVKGGHRDMVKLLLEHGAAIKPTLCFCPISNAARLGHVGILEDLLAHTDESTLSENHQALHWAAAGSIGYSKKQRADAMLLLLDRGFGIEVKGRPGNMPHHRATPLLTACAQDERTASPEVVQVLLERGANVYARDSNGDTALHLALRQNDRRILDLVKVHAQGSWTLEDYHLLRILSRSAP